MKSKKKRKTGKRLAQHFALKTEKHYEISRATNVQ